MEGLGYSPKSLSFDEEGRKKLISGIDKISRAVKSTLGPRGKTVLIESQNHTHGMTVTKDGVTVAKAIDLLDPVENLAVRIMKRAADKTAQDAGDGTTTAIVLTEALIKEFYDIGIDGTLNVTETLRHLEEICRDTLARLSKSATPVGKRKLLDVATISANNDKVLGKLIADTYKEVGENGIVTVENSQSEATYSDVTRGFKFDRGYGSSLFINNHKRDECILEDVYVLVSDAEISNVLTIESILKPILTQNKKLLLIAPCSGNVINTLAANVMKNKIKVCTVQPPQFGYKQHELMNDIALSIGATYFSEQTGDDLSIINFNDLGHAQKVIIGRESTIIIKDEGDSDRDKDIGKRVSELWEQHKSTEKKSDQDFILHRIASLTGGVGVIYAGGTTDLEQKERYDRIDDAVCAVRSALQEGILPGAGISLITQAQYINSTIFAEAMNHKDGVSKEKEVAMRIFSNALRAPFRQIMTNAGLNPESIAEEIALRGGPIDDGYDVKNDKYGSLLKLGVIDPAKVTKSALGNAVSVAITILSTNAIITLARTYESSQ